MMLLAPLLGLLLLPLSFAASVASDHDKLVQLAASNNGVIPLDEAAFNALTNPQRTWSAAIQFTAMDKRRKCIPCKCVFRANSCAINLCMSKGIHASMGRGWRSLDESR